MIAPKVIRLRSLEEQMQAAINGRRSRAKPTPDPSAQDGADRALMVIDSLPAECRGTAMRIVRDAIDQRIGVRSRAAERANRAAEAVFKGRSAA